MKRLPVLVAIGLCICMNWAPGPGICADPIIIGVPTALTAIEGRESLNVVEMAVGEINAKGGVKVGDAKRTLKIEKIDLRDASPGVPVSEALIGIEKIITEKKVHALVVGPFRSEALLAGMDIMEFNMHFLGTEMEKGTKDCTVNTVLDFMKG